MKTLWRRVRAGIGMGLIWALGGMFIGGVIELIDNLVPGGFMRQVDMWPQTLALLGFLGGLVFAAVLGVAARNRRFSELSLGGLAALGAIAGALLGAFGISKGAPAAFLIITTLGSTAGAAGSLALARRAERRDLPAGERAAG